MRALLVLLFLFMCFDASAGSLAQIALKGAEVSNDDDPTASFTVIVRNGDGFCSGVLIGEDLVLTAGHCISEDHDLTVSFRVARFSLVAIPAAAKAVNLIDPGPDLGLIRLVRPAPYNFFPASLNWAKSLFVPREVVIAGFGRHKENTTTDRKLRRGTARVVNWNEHYVFISGDVSASHGDSGAPVLVRSSTDDLLVAGVVSSRGVVDGVPVMVVTPIFPYLDWIEQEAGESLLP